MHYGRAVTFIHTQAYPLSHRHKHSDTHTHTHGVGGQDEYFVRNNTQG